MTFTRYINNNELVVDITTGLLTLENIDSTKEWVSRRQFLSIRLTDIAGPKFGKFLATSASLGLLRRPAAENSPKGARSFPPRAACVLVWNLQASILALGNVNPSWLRIGTSGPRLLEG